MRPPPARAGTSRVWFPLALAVLTALAYINAAPRTLIYDDEAVLARHPRLGGIETIPRLFREPARTNGSRLYRPLAMSTLALERSLHGGDPRGYHVTSIALHVVATLVLLGFLRALGAPLLWAFMAALVFGVHPIHTEVVAVAYNRSEILATIGVTAALWWLRQQVERRPGAAFAGTALLYFLALLCRESAVTLPVLAGLTLWLMGPGATRREQARLLTPLLVLGAPLLLYLWLRQGALGGGAGGVLTAFSDAVSQPGGGPLRRLVLLSVTLRDYWGMLVWPWPLRATYEDYAVRGLGAAVALHCGLLGAAAVLARRAPAFALGVLFFYVAMLPSTKLLSDPAVLAERFVYLPSVGPAVGLAFGLAWLASRFGRRAAFVAGSALAALLLPLSLRRNLDWRSKAALWEAEVRNGPTDWKALHNLSQVYLGQRRYEDAVALCDRGLAVAWQKQGLHTNRAIALASLGRIDEAEASFLRSLELNPGDPVEHANLARLYVMAGRRVEAQKSYERAIAAEADPALAHALRGEMLLRCHQDAPGARGEFEAALTLAPRLRPALTGLREVEELERRR